MAKYVVAICGFIFWPMYWWFLGDAVFYSTLRYTVPRYNEYWLCCIAKWSVQPPCRVAFYPDDRYWMYCRPTRRPAATLFWRTTLNRPRDAGSQTKQTYTYRHCGSLHLNLIYWLVSWLLGGSRNTKSALMTLFVSTTKNTRKPRYWPSARGCFQSIALI